MKPVESYLQVKDDYNNVTFNSKQTERIEQLWNYSNLNNKIIYLFII